MPYIKPEQRPVLDGLIKTLSGHCTSAGQANYIITRFIHETLSRQEKSYAVINQAIGILECAKLELYRMIVVPYENKKAHDNGCVSNLDRDMQVSNG